MMRLSAMMAALLLLVAPLHAGDSDSGWRMIQAVGEVSISSAGGLTLIAVKPNDPIPVQAVVQTGATGRAVLVRGNESVMLAPQTRITLPKSSDPSRTILLQSAGRALFQIGKRPVAHFEVQTPYLAAVVKGTTFEVDVAAEFGVVDVTEGAVEVTNGANNEKALVRGGNRIRIDLHGRTQAGRAHGPSFSPATTLTPVAPMAPAVLTVPAGGPVNPVETSAGLVEFEAPAIVKTVQTGATETHNAPSTGPETALATPAPSQEKQTTGTGANTEPSRETAALDPVQETPASTPNSPSHDGDAGSGQNDDKAAAPNEEEKTPNEEAAVPGTGSDAGNGHAPDVSDPKDNGKSGEAPGRSEDGPSRGHDDPPGQPKGPSDTGPAKPGKGKSKT